MAQTEFYDAGCNCWDCVHEDASINTPPPVSHRKTPWAVRCRIDGQVFLTSHEYRRQLCRPDSRWECPVCGGIAGFDDDNHEDYMDLMEAEAHLDQIR